MENCILRMIGKRGLSPGPRECKEGRVILRTYRSKDGMSLSVRFEPFIRDEEEKGGNGRVHKASQEKITEKN